MLIFEGPSGELLKYVSIDTVLISGEIDAPVKEYTPQLKLIEMKKRIILKVLKIILFNFSIKCSFRNS